jgi:ABC-2 type transport system permease protein
MSLDRVGILLGKELFQGPKSFIFVWAVVAPIVISLVVSLVFGTLFTEKPKLGILDEGNSRVAVLARELPSVVVKEYRIVPEIRAAARSGAVDVGIVLPDGFDSSVGQGKRTEIVAYTWGEGLAKDRAILGITVVNLTREATGQDAPVEITSITLGDEVSVPWVDRLLPFIVLMAVFVGGLLLPAASVINEKETRTLVALVVTPTSVGDVFLAKGVMGVLLSLLMGVAVLALNQAFGAEPALLILVLALGAIMAGELGLLLAAFIKDFTTLFSVWKLGGILLFGPAIVFMFPQIPEWVAKVFPTYYLVQPIVEITQRGGGLPDIAVNVAILVGLDLLLVVVVLFALKRARIHAG